MPVDFAIRIRWLGVAAAAVSLALASAAPAFAWGTEGHRMVALIAERHLTAAPAATVNRLLAIDHATSTAEVANWADDWRVTHPNTGAWHFVDIPVDAAGYDPDRDCHHRACAVAKINEYIRILGNDSQSDADREEALKFLIHFVADVHRPRTPSMSAR